ncbi:MAG: hypothetical protein ACRD9S_20955 [Pyrinomonadaceae bacterium]
MPEAKLNIHGVCARFSQIYWHDSKLLDLHLLRHPEKKKYDLRLDLDLIVGFSEGNVERRKQSALFRDCRIIQTDLDLLGVLICGGDIGSAGCYLDAVELEKKKRDRLRRFDLPQDQNPLEACIGFFIEMIPPGGELIVFARNFELV